jgi:hypothetical protein
VLGAEAVDEQVVNDRAALGRERRVLRLPVGEFRGVVRAEAVDEGDGVGAAHLYLAHVRDVEDAGARARGHVLLDRARGVLDGHVPPAELHHAAAQTAVHRVQGRLLQCGRAHTRLLRSSGQFGRTKC